jgi:hypothetical protein
VIRCSASRRLASEASHAAAQDYICRPLERRK